MKNKGKSRRDVRRDALSKIGMAAGAAVWHKPLIEVIALPAHAVTTDATGAAATGAAATTSQPGAPTPPNDNGTTQPPGGNGTPPPGPPCDCTGAVRVRVKANWTGSDATTGSYIWEASPGEGANDCIKTGDTKANGGNYGYLSGGSNARGATFVLVGTNCKIIQAAHKAGSPQSTNNQHCVLASIDGSCGGSATFTPNNTNNKDISHIELIIECCPT